MRTVKLLTALAATLAITGLYATTATADVTVANPAGYHPFEGRIDLDGHDSYQEEGTCNVDLLVITDYAGAIYVSHVDVYGGPGGAYLEEYSEPACGVGHWYTSPPVLDHCGNGHDGGWYGQILGPGDEWDSGLSNHPIYEYTGTGDFEALILACSYWSGEPHLPLRFALDTDYENTGAETWSLPHQEITTGLTISGTQWDDPANDMELDIQTVE